MSIFNALGPRQRDDDNQNKESIMKMLKQAQALSFPLAPGPVNEWQLEFDVRTNDPPDVVVTLNPLNFIVLPDRDDGMTCSEMTQ